jgi:predicted dehydrogenase
MKSILIIGHGKWANKILSFLKKKKTFHKIYVKTRKEIFILQNKVKKKIKILPQYNHIDLVHVCSPLSTHYFYLKKFQNHKSLIIEKPFLKNLNEFFKIKKKNYNAKGKVLVNYIDLYNPIIHILKKRIKCKITRIIFEYSDPKSFFKKKYMCVEDWLEHPLSLILFLFKKFTKYKILKKISIKNKKKFLEKVEIEFAYRNIIVVIRINFQNKKTRKIYCFEGKELNFLADLKKNIIIKKNICIVDNSNNNSITRLYSSALSRKRTFYQSFSFYEKVLTQRVDIINSLKKITNCNKF